MASRVEDVCGDTAHEVPAVAASSNEHDESRFRRYMRLREKSTVDVYTSMSAAGEFEKCFT